ncbi:hybrid sensor histidine kinase/response regulator [Paenibacillus vini]|uniref:histidine kinase n=1 Tax=Paenibacillus vini TaxID=1476024 RepID=A0ABQ4MBM8_9BACL|nr:ATP-binding protein [Paenibacillus vini]GIP53401.1 hypothetical protein J42TS3_24360 [Paenibacillus vini]
MSNNNKNVISKKKMFLYLGLFLLILLSLRLLWFQFRTVPPHPHAHQGVIDLRDWKFNDKQVVYLNGEWEFIPGVLWEPAEDGGFIPNAEQKEKWIKVPGKWNQAVGNKSGYGYGTYRLRVLVEDAGQIFGLRIQNIQSASKLYVNGELLKQTGNPAANRALYQAQNIPYTVQFKPDGNEFEIVIQAANYKMYSTGGITQSIKFGTAEAVSREVFFTQSMQIIVCVVLLLHALYAGILYLLGHRGRELAYFSVTLFFAIISILIDDDKMLLVWLPIDFDWSLKIRIAVYTAIPAFLTLCIRALLGSRGFKKGTAAFVGLCAVNLLLIICLPVQYIIFCRYVLLIIMLSVAVLVPSLIFETIRKGERTAFFILLSAVALSTNILIGGVFKSRVWPDMPYYPFDFIIAFLSFCCFWFIRFSQMTIRSRKLADELQKADKLKDDFLANTSHELRNPLHGMINMAQGVLENETRTLSESSRGNLQLIVTVGQRMSLLLNDLIDVTLLRERNVRLNKRSVHLQGVIVGVFDMLRYLTDGKAVELVHMVPDSFPKVIADENRLVQILFNLIHNSIKFTEKGIISVEAELQDGLAIIRVKDSGIGMDEETRRIIFRPYEQAETVMSGAGGIGLGLSICKQLVELHGGTLEVQSSPGEGSVFEFRLEVDNDLERLPESEIRHEIRGISDLPPVAEGVIRAAENDVATAVTSEWRQDSPVHFISKPRILAVDDDPINLKILGNILSAEQYDLSTASGGRDALKYLEQGDWDLVISDVMMPQMSGYELTRMIRTQYGMTELPVLLLTARSRQEDIYTGFAAGANDYVTKPVGSLDLKARVQALIHLRHSVGERLRMEAAWLQAQIQPHFLFNTLNSIASLSESDHGRMVGLLEEFGNYLQMSFNPRNLQRLVSLEFELELTRSYMYIEKERFGDRLQIQWDISGSLAAEVPPLSLQTLVENAVRHGILTRASGGTVTIRIAEEEHGWLIAVIDDGVGIEKEKLDQLLAGTEQVHRGIGLINTDRRLKQIYGRGLSITSISGQGTTVSFKIPKQTGN